MFSGPHRCDHCGDETVYGNHKACRLGSPQDQEEARRAMKGSPESVYSMQGHNVTKEQWDRKPCLHKTFKGHGDEWIEFCILTDKHCVLLSNEDCDEREVEDADKTICPKCKVEAPALCWDDGDILCVNCKERKHNAKKRR